MDREWFETWFSVIKEIHEITGNDRVTAVAWQVISEALLEKAEID